MDVIASSDRELEPNEFKAFSRGEEHQVARIKQLESLHKNFRGDFLGWFEASPVVGERFTMWGEPLGSAETFRQLCTSPVVEICKETQEMTVFKTHHSVYVLEHC